MTRYEEGQVLNLRAGPQGTPITVRIHKCNTPWTLSATMIVDVLEADAELSLPKRAFLKLHDRRFAEQHRDDKDVDPWTPEVERDLIEFSRSGETKAFLAELDERERESDVGGFHVRPDPDRYHAKPGTNFLVLDCSSSQSKSSSGSESESDDEEWDAARNEAYLFHGMRKEYETEAKVYDSLQEHQGV
ncbi:hypothetical protein IMZ48_42965, partial [Candidatus Bathyarchaeota archaeon]|nr:hypothetical protein [Candidatus Bathyarchaeota archaeon]